MRQKVIKNFDKGTIDYIEDYSIPENAASRSLNWITRGDKIELSGGYSVIGTEQEGTGQVTGIAMPQKVDGSTLPVITRGQKVLYYDDATKDWVESGSDVLGSDADGEQVTLTPYTSLAGYQLWIGSPNSSLYKMMLANPDDIVDQYNASVNFKGYIKAANNRLLLWYREGFRNIIHFSHKDLQDSTVYSSVSSEAIGSSGSTNYTGTLAFKSGGARRTCFNVVFTDGTQTAQDDKNGNFVGDATGTINYATGAYNITFSATTTGSVTSDYEYEDSTSNGIADFSFSATRVAGEGSILLQPTGGDLLNILQFKQAFYCLHENNAWLFNLADDDVTITNEEWRDKVGMINFRAAVATGGGIYYIDTSNPSEPRFKILSLEVQNEEVTPKVVSFNVDLKKFDFNDGVAYEWGDYIIFCCKELGETKNNRMWVFDRKWQSFDLLDYAVQCLGTKDGLLWAGDSQTNNVLQLFTGYTANDAIINNYWEGALTQLDFDQIKKFKRLTIEGDIQPSQTLEVYLSYDRGSFTLLGEINGNGPYVDKSNAVTVGSPTIASTIVGGGSNGVTAFHYRREFRVRSDKFDEIKIKFVAKSVGYASVSTQDYYDIRVYDQKNLRRYRTT